MRESAFFFFFKQRSQLGSGKLSNLYKDTHWVVQLVELDLKILALNYYHLLLC